MPVAGSGVRGSGERFAVGKPRSRPASVAADDGSLEPRRTAQQVAGLLDSAVGQEPADPRGRHGLAARPKERDHVDVEAQACALVGQRLGRAARAVAVVEVLPHAHVPGVERVAKDVVGEVVRRDLRERRVEADHDQLVRAELLDERRLAGQRRQLRRCELRAGAPRAGADGT